MGDWNHLPGVSGHWCDSGSSSSSSGDPLEISSMTGGKSSCGMREVEAAAGVLKKHFKLFLTFILIKLSIKFLPYIWKINLKAKLK